MSSPRLASGAPTETEKELDADSRESRIEYIEFKSTNIAATKAFYAAVFGWRFTDFGPDYTSFEDGRLSGGFSTAEAVEAGGPLIVIYTADLEALQRRVRDHGGSIVEPIFAFPAGHRFHFADPSGNVLAVWSEEP